MSWGEMPTSETLHCHICGGNERVRKVSQERDEWNEWGDAHEECESTLRAELQARGLTMDAEYCPTHHAYGECAECEFDSTRKEHVA